MWPGRYAKKAPPHQPLHNICIYSAFLATDREKYLENSYVPVQLCLQQNCNFGPLSTDRKLSKWLCRAEERALMAKLGTQVFLLSAHQEHLFSSKPPTSVVGKRQSFVLLCCSESLAYLGVCDLAISSNTALSTQNTHQQQCLRQEVEKYKEDHSGFGKCWRGKAISVHCPWFTPWFFPSAQRIETASWWNSCENHKEFNKSKMD